MPEARQIHIICTVTNDLVYDQRMHRIARSLSTAGFEVELVGRKLPDSPELPENAFKSRRLHCLFHKGFLFYAAYNIRLFLYLLFTRFDIVNAADLDTLPAAVLAAKLKRKKVVYDAHEYFPESPELIGRPRVQAVWYALERSLVPKVDAMYTVTNTIAAIFRKQYGRECEVIRNLPELQPDQPVNQEPGKYLLYQGAVNIGRGLNEMLLTMLKVDEMPFYIAGDGDEMQHIRDSIRHLHLEGKVKLLGKQPPQKLREITAEACIGVNLLENRGKSYYYSLGNKTFDYIHAAVPQIMIGFPEYIQLNRQYEVGVIVDELSVEKIEAAIRRLLRDPELYRRLRQNCLKAREELCWRQEEKILLRIYRDLCK